MNAPFSRTTSEGYHGNDVWVMQDALRRWGKERRPSKETEVRRYAPTGNFGTPTTVQVKHFQKLHNVNQTGFVGQLTWDLLEPYFTAKDVVLAQDYYDRTHAMDDRQAIAHAAMEGYAHRYNIRYVQVRPMKWASDHTKHVENLYAEDCSSFSTWCYYVGTEGKVDPNGMHFDGYGNTDSMMTHGRWTHKPQVADLVLYRNPGHVAVIVRIDQRGIYVVSNGHYPMAFTRYNYGHSIVGFKSYL